jgi:hypothetical protein
LPAFGPTFSSKKSWNIAIFPLFSSELLLNLKEKAAFDLNLTGKPLFHTYSAFLRWLAALFGRKEPNELPRARRSTRLSTRLAYLSYP